MTPLRAIFIRFSSVINPNIRLRRPSRDINGTNGEGPAREGGAFRVFEKPATAGSPRYAWRRDSALLVRMAAGSRNWPVTITTPF
jgi:hypothetical protein